MRRIRIRKISRPRANRDGVVLIMALLVMAMVTVMGVYSATRASLEQQIASNMRSQSIAFFVAESGLDHARLRLADDFKNDPVNQVKAKLTPPTPDWDFLLAGATAYWCGPTTPGGTDGCADGASKVDGPFTAGQESSPVYGVLVVTSTYADPSSMGDMSVRYTVTAWDNLDFTGDPTDPDYGDTSPTDDMDGVIYIRSYAVVMIGGVEVASAMQQINLTAQITGLGQIVPGLSQEFANEGKSASTIDTAEIDVGTLATGAGTAI